LGFWQLVFGLLEKLTTKNSFMFFENRIGVNFCLGEFIFPGFDRLFRKEIWFGQARKGKWWMPWRQEAMKDAISCEKLRGAAK
jgi:hypothetical protein